MIFITEEQALKSDSDRSLRSYANRLRERIQGLEISLTDLKALLQNEYDELSNMLAELRVENRETKQYSEDARQFFHDRGITKWDNSFDTIDELLDNAEEELSKALEDIDKGGLCLDQCQSCFSNAQDQSSCNNCFGTYSSSCVSCVSNQTSSCTTEQTIVCDDCQTFQGCTAPNYNNICTSYYCPQAYQNCGVDQVNKCTPTYCTNCQGSNEVVYCDGISDSTCGRCYNGEYSSCTQCVDIYCEIAVSGGGVCTTCNVNYTDIVVCTSDNEGDPCYEDYGRSCNLTFGGGSCGGYGNVCDNDNISCTEFGGGGDECEVSFQGCSGASNDTDYCSAGFKSTSETCDRQVDPDCSYSVECYNIYSSAGCVQNNTGCVTSYYDICTNGDRSLGCESNYVSCSTENSNCATTYNACESHYSNSGEGGGGGYRYCETNFENSACSGGDSQCTGGGNTAISCATNYSNGAADPDSCTGNYINCTSTYSNSCSGSYGGPDDTRPVGCVGGYTCTGGQGCDRCFGSTYDFCNHCYTASYCNLCYDTAYYKCTNCNSTQAICETCVAGETVCVACVEGQGSVCNGCYSTCYGDDRGVQTCTSIYDTCMGSGYANCLNPSACGTTFANEIGCTSCFVGCVGCNTCVGCDTCQSTYSSGCNQGGCTSGEGGCTSNNGPCSGGHSCTTNLTCAAHSICPNTYSG